MRARRSFSSGAGIIWTFLGSDRGWRCWQFCQSLADGFVMWALECPIWEGAGAKLTHSHIFPGMCSCTYVQGQEKPVKEITPAHPSSILLPGSALDPSAAPSSGHGQGPALPGGQGRLSWSPAWDSTTSELWRAVTGRLHTGSSRLVRAGNAIPELSLCWFLALRAGFCPPVWNLQDLSPCP